MCLRRVVAAFLLQTSFLFAQNPVCPPPVSRITIAAGSYRPDVGVSFRLTRFQAQLVRAGSTAPACYQKMTVVSHAVIFVSNDSLTHVFSKKMGKSQSKIQDLQIKNDPNGATLSGTVRLLIPVRFSISGPVTTDGNVIRLYAKTVKADDIPIKELLHLVGAELSSVLQLKDVSGVSVEDESISFSPEKVAHLKGHIASVTTSAEGLTLRYTPS